MTWGEALAEEMGTGKVDGSCVCAQKDQRGQWLLGVPQVRVFGLGSPSQWTWRWIAVEACLRTSASQEVLWAAGRGQRPGAESPH